MDFYSLETGNFTLNINNFNLIDLLNEISNIVTVFAELK